MQVTSSTRTGAIFRALLADEHTHARDELLASGVSERRITGLYPYDLAALNDGLSAYMRAGKRITLRHPSEVHRAISDSAFPLYALLSFEHVRENSNAYDSRWAANSKTAQATIDHPEATFNEMRPAEGFEWFVSDHEVQANSLLAHLNVGLLYAQQLSPDSGAGAYLGALVDTYLPDLLENRAPAAA